MVCTRYFCMSLVTGVLQLGSVVYKFGYVINKTKKHFTMIIMRISNLPRIHYCQRYCYNKYSTQLLSDFPEAYKPKDIEVQWYDFWEKNKYFAVKDDSQKEALKMLLPPPNITGTLHLGHALTVTIQDVLARWYRMKGHPVIWVPGLDHAGIATQTMIEKYLSKTKGITKSDISKEEFLSFVWEWKGVKENVIKSQLKALGASLDWSREYFTMSEEHKNAVMEAFIALDSKKLLYRKKDLINWCPTLKSTISDIEVEYVYIKQKTQFEVPGYKKKIAFGEIAQIAFPIKDSKEVIVVATTRPETLFGDVAIAVHPDNERYAKYIGQQVWHALRETYIPIIAESLIDNNFGTGAVKITPAHDHLDYQIAMNHQLDIIEVIDQNGNITEAGKQYKGLPRYIAREKVLHDLANKDLLISLNDHEMAVPRCSRSHDIIEYLLKEQWFIKCKRMAQNAVEAVKQGHLKIVPKTHEDRWYNYLENIRDWCISRQLWWGHSIPAYYVTVGNTTQWIVSRNKADAQLIAQNMYGPDVEVHQDEDVLDTWFSSAILPFSIYGWPKETEDFNKYYPLTLMETGYDILFFWVAKMVMLGQELTNRLPFNEVFLHGILCDASGKKMSKSLGNIISPENVINGINLNDLTAQLKNTSDLGVLNKTELKKMLSAHSKMLPKGVPECGADALRMTLCSLPIKKEKIHFDVLECQANKFFGNKIWQASKYVLLTTCEKPYQEPKYTTIIDRWILSRLFQMVSGVNDAFVDRNFHNAVASIKQFFRYEYCDYYLEATKWGFNTENMDIITSHTYSLRKCLEVSLRVLAPIMPYLVEDLYKRLSNKFSEFLSVTSIIEAPYPTPEQFDKWRDDGLNEKMGEVLIMVSEIRSLMARVNKKLNPEVHIVTSDFEDFNFYNETISLIKGGSKIFNVSVFHNNDYTESENSVHYSIFPNCTLYIISQNSSSLELIRANRDKKLSEEKGSSSLKDSI